MTQNAEKASRAWTCDLCGKRCELKQRDGGVFVPLHADGRGMCRASGNRVLRDVKIDSVSVATVESEDPWEHLNSADLPRHVDDVIGPQVSAEVCVPKAMPPDVVRAAQRLDQNFADARDGGYYRYGWYGYMDRLDIERLISHVLAAPRSSE